MKAGTKINRRAMLTPRQRMALRLWRKRYTTQQVAEMMETKYGAAAMLIHRAKKALEDRGVDLNDWIDTDEVLHGE